MNTYFIIVETRDRCTPRLSSTQDGDLLATLFETESDAGEFASHLDDRASLRVVPLATDKVVDWLHQRKNSGAEQVYMQRRNGPPLTEPIEMFVIHWRANPNP